MSENQDSRAALLVAIIALGGVVFQGFNQSRISARQEDKRLQSELIIRAVEAGKPKQALSNLQFLLDAGLIDDENGEISALIARGEIDANFSLTAEQLKIYEMLGKSLNEVLMEGSGSGGGSGGPTKR